METFFVAANIVFPLLVLMILGFVLRQSGLIAEETFIRINRLNFYAAIPALCFKSIYESDFSSITGPKLALTVLISILVNFVLCLLIVPKFCKDSRRRGTLILALSRSNDVIFGLAVARSLFPADQLAPFMLCLAISAPLFNLLSVVGMELNRGGTVLFLPTVKRILLNPIIIGCVIGGALSLLSVKVPAILLSPVNSVASIGMPLTFIIIGSRIHFSAFRNDRKVIALVSLFRLILIPAVMLLIGALLRFDAVGMVTLLSLFGSPCATVLYAFSSEMGGDEQLASELTASTSLFSVFTIFCFICVLKAFGGI